MAKPMISVESLLPTIVGGALTSTPMVPFSNGRAILVKVTISPAGPRGHRVEYFFTKSRHRTLVPLGLIGALCFLLNGSLMWETRRGTALVFVGMGASLLIMWAALWRRGRQQSREIQRQRREIMLTPPDSDDPPKA